VPSLRLAPSLTADLVVTAVGAVLVPTIAKAAEVEETTALVARALKFPKADFHPTRATAENWSPSDARAKTKSSNAPPAATRGSEV
jgi:hypothetical protein